MGAGLAQHGLASWNGCDEKIVNDSLIAFSNELSTLLQAALYR
jgi:hypothetical protein